MPDNDDHPVRKAAVEIDINDPEVRRKFSRKKQAEANGHARKEPLEQFSPEGEIPPRIWTVDDHIPANNVTLLSGEGAVGKSILAMQLGVVMALNAGAENDRDWLGLLPKGGGVLMITCEEDEDEARRRLEDICQHYHARRSDLVKAFFLCSWVNRETTILAALDKRSDSLKMTELYDRTFVTVQQLRPRLIILDTAADLFGGSEINRNHTRQFIAYMRALALGARNDASVLMLTHPSLEGIRSGSGLSGSTAWHNSVRSRCVMKKFSATKSTNKKGGDPGDEEPDADPDLRQIEWRKNNYGPAQETVTVRWQRGVYVVAGTVQTLSQQLRERSCEAVFLDMLRKRNAQQRPVSDRPGVNFAPAVFADTDEARAVVPRVTSREFSKAMERLFNSGAILRVKTTDGPPSKRTWILVEAIRV